MKAHAPRMLMPGTAPERRGEVAALVAVLRTGSLFEQAQLRYANSHREGNAASYAGRARKLLLLWLARFAGCREVFHRHGAGFRQFAIVRNSALMRRPIRHIFERSAGLQGLGERTRARVVQHYSTQAVCGRLAAIYTELAGAR